MIMMMLCMSIVLVVEHLTVFQVCLWVYVGVCGCMWVFVGVCGCMWLDVGVYGCVGVCVAGSVRKRGS